MKRTVALASIVVLFLFSYFVSDQRINQVIAPTIEGGTNALAENLTEFSSLIESNTSINQDQRLEALPVTTLFPYLPAMHAKMFNKCGISENFPLQLKEVVNVLATKKYDDDYSSIIAALQTPELRNLPDAQAILGSLYQQHLVPEVAFTFQSDDIAFDLYEAASNNKSELGDWHLAMSYYYGYPSRRWREEDEESVQQKYNSLIDEKNWQKSAGFLLRNLYAFNDENNTPEEAEALYRESFEQCDTVITRYNLAQHLIDSFGVQSIKGSEGLSLLLEDHSAYSYEKLGYLYSDEDSLSTIFAEEFIDYDLALEYLEKSARIGDSTAAYWVFYNLKYDDNYSKDEDLAIEMLELAASLGDWRAIAYKANFLTTGEKNYYEQDIPNAIRHVRQLIQLKEGGDSLYQSDLIWELDYLVTRLLLEEELDKKTIESAIDLTNHLISLLQEDDNAGELANAERNLAAIISKFGSTVTNNLATVDFGTYHALVIGNNKYEHLPDLKAAVSDASAISELLAKQYGFKVQLLLNATRTEIVSTLNSYRNSLGPTDNFLIYYAGHGQIDPETAEGFWQPVDARPNDDTDWIGNDRITRTLRGFDSDNILVVADSCYSGVVLRGTERLENPEDLINAEYVTRLLRRKTRMAFTSGGVEPVVDSLPGTENSIFALALLNTLRANDSVMTATDIYRRVAQDVVANLEAINRPQTPEFSGLLRSGHEGGDFFFKSITQIEDD